MNGLKLVAGAALAFALAACSGQYDAAQYGPGSAVQPARPTQTGQNVAAKPVQKSPEPIQKPTAAPITTTPTPQPQNVIQAPNAPLSASTAELINAMALSGDELFIVAALAGFAVFLLFAWFMSFVVLGHAQRAGK